MIKSKIKRQIGSKSFQIPIWIPKAKSEQARAYENRPIMNTLFLPMIWLLLPQQYEENTRATLEIAISMPNWVVERPMLLDNCAKIIYSSENPVPYITSPKMSTILSTPNFRSAFIFSAEPSQLVIALPKLAFGISFSIRHNPFRRLALQRSLR